MSDVAPEQIHVHRAGEVVVVSFVHPYLQAEDEINKVTAEIAAVVESRKPPLKLLLSFTGVRFVSSSMLAQLVKLHNRLSKAKGRLRVCGLTPAVRDVVHASHLDRLFEVYDDEAAALAKF